MRILLALLILLAIERAVSAQVVVSKSGSAKSALDWSGFAHAASSAGALFRQTLESDLVRSGWFARAGKGSAQYTLLGSSEDAGDGLQAKCSVYGTADSRNVLNKSYRESSGKAARMAHQMADDIVEAVSGRKGIASTRVAMVGTRSRSKELYVIDADGKNLIQLTQDKSVCVAPKWSPDARQLLYTAYLKRFPDLYLVELASGHRERVASFPGLNTGGSFSPSGREIAMILSKDGNPELYVKNVNSGTLTRMTATRNAAEASPSWSPDGNRIVYVSDQSGRPQLYIISRQGGAPIRLSMRGSENVSPDWGPDYGSGGFITFSSLMGGQYQVCVMNPNTGEMKVLTQDGANYEDPSWGRDGRHIVCTRSERYRPRVYILDTLGDPPVALTQHEGDWYSPDWSP